MATPAVRTTSSNASDVPNTHQAAGREAPAGCSAGTPRRC